MSIDKEFIIDIILDKLVIEDIMESLVLELDRDLTDKEVIKISKILTEVQNAIEKL